MRYLLIIFFNIIIHYAYAKLNIAVNTPAEAIPIIIPASNTPPRTAITLFLKPISRKLAASVPVHAPVPGIGIPTNNKSAIKSIENFWKFRKKHYLCIRNRETAGK